MPNVLEALKISKHYAGARALSDVNFALAPGEVHALMGENGAGKSTLSRILAGVTICDSGDICVDGKVVRIQSPQQAQQLGIAIIFQELDLFPNLTVAENIVIGNLRFPSSMLARQNDMLHFAQPFLREVGLDLTGKELILHLSIAQQQLIAIARALSMQARVILMDEPTSSLTQDAADRLFVLIAQLKARGVAIVYVSHKMDEIFRICDRMTVLRDGELVGTRNREDTNTAELIRMMVGRHMELSKSAVRKKSTEEVLRVEGLCTGKLRDISFTLNAGEVLGLAGLVGAGRSELGAALFGLDPILSGSILLRGKELKIKSAAQAMQNGIGLVPEDRKHEGLMMQMSVLENSTFAILSRLNRVGVMSRSAELEAGNSIQQRLRLKCASLDADVNLLSGGNQQKALLARWLLLDPEILFLDDPARGIDVGAKEDIYQVIEELASQKKGILLASSELPELLRCCDRILVLSEGRLTAILDGNTTTQEEIMAAATQAHTSHHGPVPVEKTSQRV
jgi:ABC-type sugar transport system ATPase subunit